MTIGCESRFRGLQFYLQKYTNQPEPLISHQKSSAGSAPCDSNQLDFTVWLSIVHSPHNLPILPRPVALAVIGSCRAHSIGLISNKGFPSYPNECERGLPQGKCSSGCSGCPSSTQSDPSLQEVQVRLHATPARRSYDISVETARTHKRDHTTPLYVYSRSNS